MAERATTQNDVRQLVGKDCILVLKPLREKPDVLSCAFKVSLVCKGGNVPGVVC